MCTGCQHGKPHQLPFEDSQYKEKEPFKLAHLDVFGLAKHLSISGFTYTITFINDYLSHIYIYF